MTTVTLRDALLRMPDVRELVEESKTPQICGAREMSYEFIVSGVFSTDLIPNAFRSIVAVAGNMVRIVRVARAHGAVPVMPPGRFIPDWNPAPTWISVLIARGDAEVDIIPGPVSDAYSEAMVRVLVTVRFS